ncbi:probable poly(ADP-ribose) glycohydrolase 2 isoform X2 [Papaver somniferum]|uniref:probable poly(ADP-ribose) glycohydrolase 2 isoform X2 n=1 Tax=Papaver somniferum TaxID=3469 RepID=UPI000E6F835E|nr:probable poly(ADP-ribose) glycohydrolase 2 isoform X2 [Papaver somniferum]
MMTLLKMCSFVLQVFKSSAVWVMILVSFFAMFVPEEIRFMINSELIVSMLFLPCMDDNEAIEIVGVERFSIYTGTLLLQVGKKKEHAGNRMPNSTSNLFF